MLLYVPNSSSEICKHRRMALEYAGMHDKTKMKWTGAVDILERVQQYLRSSSAPTVQQVGPFVVLLDSTDTALEKNVGMPSVPDVEQLAGGLAALRDAFAVKGRAPVLVWLEGYVPHLAERLREADWSEYQRETLLVCTAETEREVTPISGLAVVEVTALSSLADVRENLDVNEFGFEPASAHAATDEQAREFRGTLQSARAFTARLSGQAVSAGMYTSLRLGVTELVGIATLEGFRGQGIAGVLTATMVQAALGNGCDVVFVRTENPASRRVYERVGFRPISDVLTYVASGPASDTCAGDAWAAVSAPLSVSR